MPKLTKSQLATAKREEVLAMFAQYLADLGEEVMRESGNAIVFPTTDEQGNEMFVKVAVSIPRGDRSGEAYDGYAAAADYKTHCEKVIADREQRNRENAEKTAKAKERQAAAKAKKDAEAAKLEAFRAKQEAEGQ
jgi:hypothetical protein